MVGRNVKLYDMVLQFLRTLFLRTRNVHYCTLRAELLMSLHDLDVGDICSVDPCHKVDAPLASLLPWDAVVPAPGLVCSPALCSTPCPSGGTQCRSPQAHRPAAPHPTATSRRVCLSTAARPAPLPCSSQGLSPPCSRAFVVSSVFWNRAFRTALS